MLSKVEDIKDGARKLSQRLGELLNCQQLNKKQLRAVDEAEEGLAFWRRTHLAALEKTFEDSCRTTGPTLRTCLASASARRRRKSSK